MEHEEPPQPSQVAQFARDKDAGHSSPLPQPYSNLLASLHPSLPILISTITKHTPTRTLLRLTIPILTAHTLRIILPPLLFYYPAALSDMKLAKSSPHYYLLTSVTAFTYPGFILSSLYSLALKRARSICWEGMIRDKTGDGWCVLYLTLGILSLEGAFVQSCWAASQGWAYWKLFRGGQPEHDFLEGFLKEWNWRVMALLGLLVEWTVHRVWPEVGDVFVRRRWAAGVGYTGVILGTLYAVRYSNRYFVVLEMVDVWMLGVWFMVAFGVVGGQLLTRRESEQREARKQQ